MTWQIFNLSNQNYLQNKKNCSVFLKKKIFDIVVQLREEEKQAKNQKYSKLFGISRPCKSLYNLKIDLILSSVETTTPSLAKTMTGITNDRVRQKLAQLFQTNNKPHGDITTEFMKWLFLMFFEK